MAKNKPYIDIAAHSKRKEHRGVKGGIRKLLHFVLTFLVGVAIAMAYHQLVINQKVRSEVEKVCDVFGKDEQQCRDKVSEALNASDNVLDNNIDVRGE